MSILQFAWLGFITITAIQDYKTQRIPNSLILAGLGICIFAFLSVVRFDWQYVQGAFLLFFILLVVRWLGTVFFGKAGVGMGDVKLCFVMGLYLSWEALWVLYLSILFVGIWGIGLKSFNKEVEQVPFAPFVWLGSIVAFAVFPTEKIIAWFENYYIA